MSDDANDDASQLTWRARAREWLARLLCVAGVPVVSRWRRRGRLAILMYHGVEAQPASPPCSYVLDAATLRRQLTYVRRHFTVLPLHEAVERMRAGTLPRRAAALTFDDGTRNLLTHAAPVLRDLGLPAAVFLATGPMGTGEALWPDRLWLAFARTGNDDVDLDDLGLGRWRLRTATERTTAREAVVDRLKHVDDERRLDLVERVVERLGVDTDARGTPFEMLSWDDARTLAGDGSVALYPHTVTHPILSRCPDAKVRDEIAASAACLRRQTGAAPAVFAYPNGGADDFDQRARDAVRANGMDWALSTTNGFADATSDPLALPRVGIASQHSYAVFRLKVSGVHR